MPDYDVVVKAVFAKTTHTVTCNVTNGTATVDPTGEIKEGTNVTVTFKPDEDKANYVLKENPKLDSGNLHTTLNVSDGVGTFNMDKNDVIITAEFVEPTTPSEGTTLVIIPTTAAKKPRLLRPRSAPLTALLKRPPLPQWLSLPAPIRTAQAHSSWMQL